MANSVPKSPFRRTILAFGDSITQQGSDASGWVALLQSSYIRKADVLNRGFSGYNTRLALHALPSALAAAEALAQPIALTTIFFGANDATINELLPAGKPHQGIPVDEYASNLAAMVDAASAVSACTVVISAPPVNSVLWGDRSNERVQRFTAAAAEVVTKAASAAAVPVLHLNLYDVMASGGQDYSRYLSDGLHLSADGNRLLFDTLVSRITAACPAILPDALPLDLPIWRDVDPAAPAADFSAEALDKLRSVGAPLRK